MRHKITIQEKIETHQDSFGAVHFDWRDSFSCWAELDADNNKTIKYRDEVRRGMRVLLNGTIFTIGSTEEVTDGGVHLLKLKFDSARGDFARARSAPKPTALPTTHNEAGKE